MSEMTQTPELGLSQSVAKVKMQTALGIAGPYPPREVPGPPDVWMAMIHTLAFSFPPFGAPSCAGQLMPIASNTALFSILGVNFGGNGTTNFALPDLRGNIAVGGEYEGTQEGDLLACNAMIAAIPPAGPSNYPMVGMMAMFGGNYAPQGWLRADGSTLPISEYVPLFEAIGTTFGGDGASTFCLPNLTTWPPYPSVGLAPVGVGDGPMGPPVALGEEIAPYGLGLNYMISLGGVFPPTAGNGGFPDSDPVIGEVVAYAGPSIPADWAPCDGTLRDIAGSEALFELIGTTYGGNGETNFALPDLRGAAVMGA